MPVPLVNVNLAKSEVANMKANGQRGTDTQFGNEGLRHKCEVTASVDLPKISSTIARRVEYRR